MYLDLQMIQIQKQIENCKSQCKVYPLIRVSVYRHLISINAITQKMKLSIKDSLSKCAYSINCGFDHIYLIGNFIFSAVGVLLFTNAPSLTICRLGKRWYSFCCVEFQCAFCLHLQNSLEFSSNILPRWP